MLSCNLEELTTLVVNDLEFYHYKTGLRWESRPFSMESNKICRKVTRDLISGTLEVCPLLE